MREYKIKQDREIYEVQTKEQEIDLEANYYAKLLRFSVTSNDLVDHHDGGALLDTSISEGLVVLTLISSADETHVVYQHVYTHGGVLLLELKDGIAVLAVLDDLVLLLLVLNDHVEAHVEFKSCCVIKLIININ